MLTMGEEEGRYCEMNDERKIKEIMTESIKTSDSSLACTNNSLKANPIAIVAGEGRVR